MDDPIAKFQDWWQQALQESPLRQKSAVCVSTVDERGFPAARFVDLKSVDGRGFVICTYLNSAKRQANSKQSQDRSNYLVGSPWLPGPHRRNGRGC